MQAAPHGKCVFRQTIAGWQALVSPTSLAFSCWISEAMALITALLLATRFSCGRITTRAAAVAKCRAARVLSAAPDATGTTTAAPEKVRCRASHTR
jgi:hypothetical protein